MMSFLGTIRAIPSTFSTRFLSQTKKILRNARVYTGGEKPEYFEHGAVCYEGDTVLDVGEEEEIIKKFPDAEKKDMKNKLIFPGFVCAHAHFYGAFSRGMALKDDPPSNFLEVLERLWWRLDLALQPRDNYLSAMMCLVQAVRCGTTTIVDHHASPNAIEGSLDVLAEATKAAGVRACLAYEVTDRNGLHGAEKGIDENLRFLERVYGAENPDPMLGASFGLHAAFTLSDDTLRTCARRVEGLDDRVREKAGFHIHVSEDKTDSIDSMRRSGKTTVERLADFGILTSRSIAGHCVFVTEKEVEMLKSLNVKIVHNPQSNMNNGVGVSDVLALLKKGIPVGLGTDGMTMDMFAESKVNYLIHKLNRRDPRVMGSETLDMLFGNNSLIASMFFPKKVGVLEKGSFADMAVIAYDPPTFLCAGNMPWHMQFGMSSYMVESTISGGKWIMEDGVIKSLDTANVMEECRKHYPGIWERF
uniref:Amidohydrolase n=1 Tax=Stygiella incarcerata TaxID=1712417 RepID=A0A192ZIW6_9EUKA|nr:amidohydrolase [Stygiella incarcerata]